jgi:thioesterase domain-containing protein
VQHALRRYRPAPYPGRIVLFRSQHQILSSRGMGRFRDPKMGWEDLAAGGLDIREIRGGHTEIFAPPGGAAMAQVFAHIVAAAGGPRAVGCAQESS